MISGGPGGCGAHPCINGTHLVIFFSILSFLVVLSLGFFVG